jgi:hypothetical protein
MMRRILISCFATLAVGALLGPLPVRGVQPEAREFLGNHWVQAEAGRYGPFATARRANEVANYFRQRGYDAQVYSASGDYYVNAW